MGRHRKAIAVVAGIVVVCVLGLGVVAFQPWTANHFGYALPGHDGLPYRISHGERSYATRQVCAGADWCRQYQSTYDVVPPRCMTQADLSRMNMWPLTQTGWVPALLGPWYPIMTPAPPYGMSSVLIVPDGSDCYVVYSIEGGP